MPTAEKIELALDGMSCASCAAQIERSLNRLDGVEATVNPVTERAAVEYDPAATEVTDLLAAVEQAGYHAAPVHEHIHEHEHVHGGGASAIRLVVAAVLTTPLVVLAMAAPDFSGRGWIELALATPVVLWAGREFHEAAFRSARHAAAGMDTLISLGTLAAWGWSVAVLVGGLDADLYFEVAGVVTTLILLGRYFEGRATSAAGAAIRALSEVGAKDAVVFRDGREIRVPITELVVGDVFVVRPGEKIATDGTVVDGSSAVDASLLTGESDPVDVRQGDHVIGGTINSYGRLVVRATRLGADTALAQIGRLVEQAQAGKAPIQRLADRVSAVVVPIVILVSLGTLLGWLLAGASTEAAFTAAVAVLIIACPCALGLATPTALMVGTGRGAQLGIIIRGPAVLERTQRIGTIVLDKTGTVTQGKLELTDVVLNGAATRAEVLRFAGAVESASEHPVATAVVSAARVEVGDLPNVDEFRNLPGQGVRGVVEGHHVEVARNDEGIAVSWDGVQQATLTVRDEVKPTSAEAVGALRQLGLDPILLTGDAEASACRIAAEVGIDRVIAEVSPGEKLDEVRRLQSAGEVVAMVGDGVNDAPALAQADLGLAVGAGTDVAIEASDMTLVSGDLRAAADAIRLARRTLSTIKGNLFWAFAYNVAAIPLAAAGLLNPIIAAAAMACSSLFVLGNSLRLRRFRSIRT